jgi:hypothetical protein
LFMDFGRFVVVEFGIMGAAYFYHKIGFEEYIRPIKHSDRFRRTRSIQTKESMFKDITKKKQGMDLFINKLHHVGNWQGKFDSYMWHYLKDQFNYER